MSSIHNPAQIERVTLDDLAVEQLPKRLNNTVGQVEGKRSFGFYFVVEGGAVSVAFEANFTLARLFAIFTAIGTFVYALINLILPALATTLQLLLEKFLVNS